jgi:lipopolysaccharide export system protein LptA
MSRVFPFIFILIFLLSSTLSFAQSTAKADVKKIEITHANSLKFANYIANGAKRLIGEVQFKQDNVLMFCDSAYFYTDNSLDAFGHVHIQQGDSIHLHGDLLNYNGNTRKAIISKNVILDKGDMRMFTDILNYDMATSIGYYTTYARIINKENVLTSNKGYYFGKTNDLTFKNDVVLTNQPVGDKEPQFVINCDTMRYNTTSKITYFSGPTKIKSKENLIYCEDGWYDTNKDLSRFSKHSYILTKEQKMFGDSLYYDRKQGIGRAVKHVQIIDTAQNLNIKGNLAIHYELYDLSLVTGKALLTQKYEKDTLYLHADTLKAFGNSKLMHPDSKNKKIKKETNLKKDSVNENQTILAYHKVKFFKNDLQGKCDSLIYTSIDSTMKLFGQPTLWSEENQLTADSMRVVTAHQALKYIELLGTTFMVSQEDSLRFNQVRGKYMKGIFKKDTLYQINVEGNGQTIYFAKDKNKLKAVNRADCSDLHIFLKDSKINSITFITKPDATLYPLKEVDVKELILKDFTWRQKLRPLSMKDIFVW